MHNRDLQEHPLKKLFSLLKFLIFLAFIGLLGLWGSLNRHSVSWDLMVLSEPAEYQMNTVMVALLLAGFVFGVLTTLYVISRMKFANALKQRKAQKALKQQQQNEALKSTLEAQLPVTDKQS